MFTNITKFIIVCDVLLSLLIIIFTCSLWVLKPKWRTFDNYVFINVVIAAILKHMRNFIDYCIGFIFIKQFAQYAHDYWIFVMIFIFYARLLKVPMPNNKLMFCIASIFAWGLPMALLPLNIFQHMNIPVSTSENLIMNVYEKVCWIAIIYIPLLNPLIYLAVLFYLLKSCCNNFLSKVLMATLICVIGEPIIVFEMISPSEKDITGDIFTFFEFCINFFQHILVGVIIFSDETNRRIWQECRKGGRRNTINKSNDRTYGGTSAELPLNAPQDITAVPILRAESVLSADPEFIGSSDSIANPILKVDHSSRDAVDSTNSRGLDISSTGKLKM